jgi:predicted esterase
VFLFKEATMPQEPDFFEQAEAMMSLYVEGRYDQALRLTDQLAAQFPEEAATTSLWRLCLLSRTGKTAQALEGMSQALQQGLWWEERVLRDDDDLAALQGLPAYETMVAECKRRRDEAQKSARPALLVALPKAPPPYPVLIALHGRGSSAERDLRRWEPVLAQGWMLAMPQSSQCSSPAAFSWDDAALARQEIAGHYRKLAEQYPLDPERVLLGGFSQGAALAIQAAMHGPIPARGFLAVVPGRVALEGLEALLHAAPKLRGYLVSGGQDPRKEVFTHIHDLLNRNGVACAMENHPTMGHAFPADFARSIDNALKFLIV